MLRKIIRSYRWLNIAIFVVLPVTVLLAVSLLWGAQRILSQEREKISLDFFALVTHVHSQERFLRNLRTSAANLTPSTPSVAFSGVEPIPNELPLLGYQVQSSHTAVPYAVLCRKSSVCQSDGSLSDNRIRPIGDFLSDLYAAHWSRSYLPGTATLLVDAASGLALVVPALHFNQPRDPFTPDVLQQVLDIVNRQAHSVPTPNLEQVRWIPFPGMDNAMLGLISTSFRPNVWPDNGRLIAATLLTQARTNLFLSISNTAVYDHFWLLQGGGAPLIGDGAVPRNHALGTQLTRNGVIITVSDPSREWTGIYQIDYGTLFQANMWLPGSVLVLLAAALAAALAWAYWYDRRVIVPAQAAHQKLIESEEFNRTLLNTAPMALCVVSRQNGEVMFSNSIARQWLELSQKNGGTHLGPEILPPRILGAEAPGTCEPLYLNGRYVQTTHAPTRYRKQPAILLTFADITARIQYEQALARAKAEADTANAAKSRFLASVSHEIRTPLYGILGGMELLSMTPLENYQRRHLQHMQQSSSTLMQLISDVLDVTKIEAHQLALATDTFCPRLLVQSCVDHYAATAQQKHLLLFSCMDPTLPECLAGDAARIQQIINNFLSNALKFTPSGQIIVRAHSEPTVNNPTTLVVQVADSGIGISQQDQTMLFAPFYQVPSTSRVGQGTGLGLNICANLATLMQGHIEVTSAPGLGSRFSLAVPLNPCEGHDQPSPPDLSGISVVIRSPHAELTENLCQWLRKWHAQAFTNDQIDSNPIDCIFLDVLASQPACPVGWSGPYLVAGLHGSLPSDLQPRLNGYSAEDIGRGLRRYLDGGQPSDECEAPTRYLPLNLHILVAEDNLINQAILRDQLAQLGCTVTLASDGAEALQHWEKSPYHAVLTDLSMPGMNGYTLTQTLRRRSVGVPIVGITANATREEEDRCREAGMSAWLTKPIDLGTLHRCLTRLLGDGGAVGARSPSVDTPPVISEGAGTNETVPETTDLSALIQDLAALPEKYRPLFLDTMTADAEALADAIDRRDVSAMRGLLHRMRGALMSVRQSAFAARLQAAEETLAEGATEGATLACVCAVVSDLKTLIAVYPSSWWHPPHAKS